MEFSKHLSVILNAFLGLLTVLIGTFFIVNKLLLEGIAVCVIGVLLIYWFNIWKSRNHPINVFPLLDITALEKWTVKISDHYNYIKTIILYEAPLVSHKKYVLFFNFDTSTVKGKNNKGTFDGHTWSKKWSKKNYPIDDSFKEIYRQNPPNKFFKEWLITTERPQGINERLSMILYEKDT